MKNKYIKIKGHDNWFLVLEQGKPIPTNLNETMQERMFRKVAGGVHGDKNNPDWASRIAMVGAKEMDYERLLGLSKLDLLVRPFGSFMCLTKDVEVLRTVYAEDFPIDQFATVVVCENDADMPYKWLKYLKERFSGESIEVINYFDTRSDAQVKAYFKRAKYVTFTTTFTTMAWWELLVRNLRENNKVIGHCDDRKGWERALEIYPKVEQVKLV